MYPVDRKSRFQTNVCYTFTCVNIVEIINEIVTAVQLF